MSTGVVVLAAVVVVATAAGLLWQWRNGRVRLVAASDVARVSAGDIGAALGERATLVQFTTAFCAPCRATRQILGEAAELVAGVVHVDVDAESHLDLVRRLDIRRTPTVLVLDPDGRVVKRASGQPRKADVLHALGTVL